MCKNVYLYSCLDIPPQGTAEQYAKGILYTYIRKNSARTYLSFEAEGSRAPDLIIMQRNRARKLISLYLQRGTLRNRIAIIVRGTQIAGKEERSRAASATAFTLHS